MCAQRNSVVDLHHQQLRQNCYENDCVGPKHLLQTNHAIQVFNGQKDDRAARQRLRSKTSG